MSTGQCWPAFGQRSTLSVSGVATISLIHPRFSLLFPPSFLPLDPVLFNSFHVGAAPFLPLFSLQCLIYTPAGTEFPVQRTLIRFLGPCVFTSPCGVHIFH